MRQPRPQERYARALLLLTLIHTVPVIWTTPVSSGTAPTAALLGFGLASLFTFEREGMAIAMFALGPALIYCALAWLLAWLIAMALEKLPRSVRPAPLAALLGILLASVYWPIYAAGSHNASQNVNLFQLFDETPGAHFLLGYWIGLHGLLVALFAGYLQREDHPALDFIERWRKPVATIVSSALIAIVLVGNYSRFVCLPLAELGSSRAALCVARSGPGDQRYWYKRAAEQGQADAIAWMIAHTPDKQEKLYWLRKGADDGNAAIQFALYEWLMRTGEAAEYAEAEVWLRRSAEADHAPAQLVLAESLARRIHSSGTRELLAERNSWLERAAKLGARDAMRQLAQQYVDGSMGYPVNLDRARDYYRDLVDVDERTTYERMLGLDAAYYKARVAELDVWESGLKNHDPAITKLLAERYLDSQLPGPGVRELGLQLMEQLAESGDADARDTLVMLLRTGSGGVERNLEAAKRWLIASAEAGDLNAMERVAGNYASGREGFDVDYPQARHWYSAAIDETRALGDVDAVQMRARALRNELDYLDRLAQQAGGALLGAQDLEQLGRRNDAESNYQYALQLLAGHGPARRAEAIERLKTASRNGHGDAAWRLFQIYERGFPGEIDRTAAIEQLQHAAAGHHFDATRELAMRYEYGKDGLPTDLPRAIAMYEDALVAGHDNRYDWNLDPDNFNHFKWLESRLRQARMKLAARGGK